MFQELPQKTETDSTRFFVGKAHLDLSLMALDLISMASWAKFHWQSCGSHALGSCPGYTAGEGKSGRYNLLRLVVNIPVFYREFDIFQVFLGMSEASTVNTIKF